MCFHLLMISLSWYEQRHHNGFYKFVILDYDNPNSPYSPTMFAAIVIQFKITSPGNIIPLYIWKATVLFFLVHKMFYQMYKTPSRYIFCCCYCFYKSVGNMKRFGFLSLWLPKKIDFINVTHVCDVDERKLVESSFLVRPFGFMDVLDLIRFRWVESISESRFRAEFFFIQFSFSFMRFWRIFL